MRGLVLTVAAAVGMAGTGEAAGITATYSGWVTFGGTACIQEAANYCGPETEPFKGFVSPFGAVSISWFIPESRIFDDGFADYATVLSVGIFMADKNGVLQQIPPYASEDYGSLFWFDKKFDLVDVHAAIDGGSPHVEADAYFDYFTISLWRSDTIWVSYMEPEFEEPIWYEQEISYLATYTTKAGIWTIDASDMPVPVPLPATGLLAVAGLGALAAARRLG